MMAAIALLGWISSPAVAAMRIEGQVQAGGSAVAGAAVSLFAASAAAPARLAQAETDADGKFVVAVDQAPDGAESFYLVAGGGTPAVDKAGGDNKAIALLAVVGKAPPAKVVVNEMTTVASVWTNAQFLASATVAKLAIVGVCVLLSGPSIALPQPPVCRSTKLGTLPAAILRPSAWPLSAVRRLKRSPPS